MQIVVPPDAGGESRLAGIEMALLTLRCMEHYRAAAGDHHSALVLLAVVAISAEKLTRSDLHPDFRSLEEPLPDEQLATCNVSSIAVATGFNRETTRRYVNRLIERGALERTAEGAIRFTSGYLQSPEIAGLLQSQLEAMSRTVNVFLKLGAMQAVES